MRLALVIGEKRRDKLYEWKLGYIFRRNNKRSTKSNSKPLIFQTNLQRKAVNMPLTHPVNSKNRPSKDVGIALKPVATSMVKFLNVNISKILYRLFEDHKNLCYEYATRTSKLVLYSRKHSKFSAPSKP